MNHPISPLGAEFQVDFIDTTYLRSQGQSLIELIKSGQIETVNDFVICANREGHITARFGEDLWDLSPYFAQVRSNVTSVNFSRLTSSPALMLELKLIVYGWIFHKSGAQSTGAKLSTICTRFIKLRNIYYFLQNQGAYSLSALSNRVVWTRFIEYLKAQQYSLSTLEQMFTAINGVLKLEKWLDIQFGLDRLPSNKLAQELCAQNKKKKSQTLAIPQRIADDIYGKAIELVEQAWPYRQELADVEQHLQDNYLAGKAKVDGKIRDGKWQFLTNMTGHITDPHFYAQEINKASPRSANSILKLISQQGSGIPSQASGLDWKRYYGQLITACFICCGAFSGMRVSELLEITEDSYFKTCFDGKTFHMLQAKTFKLGQKKATWVTAPITEKAVQLAAVLTQSWRDEYNDHQPQKVNVLWFNKGARSKKPVIISDWNLRLQRFTQHFNILVSESDLKECIECNPNSTESIRTRVKQGKPWHMNTHQFRRTLAFYTIKHRLGNAIALKQQFKHLYLQMTDWYCAGGVASRIKDVEIDEELQQLLDSTQNELITNKFYQWSHSSAPLSGSHGKAIVAMREEGVPHLYSSWDIIYKIVKNKQLTLHGTLHSYCKNGYHCDMDGAANPAFCVDCSSGSSIIDSDNARWWQQRHTDLTRYLLSHLTVSPSIYAHCITQIRSAEVVMRDFAIDYHPYQHPIEVHEL